MRVLFVMNIFFNTCVFGAHLRDLQSTLQYCMKNFARVVKILFQFRYKSSLTCGWIRLVSWSALVLELSRVSFGTKVLFFSEIVNCMHSIIGVIVLVGNIKGIIQPDLFANLAVLLELVKKVICSDFLRPSLASAIQASSLWTLCLSDRKISIYY